MPARGTPTFYRFGEWRVDPMRNRLCREGEERQLEARNMEVLEYLIEHHDRVVTAEDLLEACWAGRIIERSTIHHHINQIRRALGDDSRRPTYIRTIFKRGYQAIAPVEVVAGDSLVPGFPGKTATDQDGLPATSVGSRTSAWWYAVFLMLMAAGTGWWAWTGRVATQSIAGAGATPSIAVLPFVNISRNANDAYFTDGMHEEILARVAKVRGLRVISHSSVMAYRNRQQNARTTSMELNARYLVKGTVRRFPNEIVVTAELIDGASDRRLWSETYRNAPEDVFGIQTAVAERIVHTLQAHLTPDEAARIRARPTDDPKAYDVYLQALDAWDKRRANVIDLLEQAVAIDPSFALAYAQIARVHRDIYFFGLDAREERLQLAKDAVDRALELEPDLPEAHLALGMYHYARRDYRRARAELETARLGLPNELPVYLNLGNVYRREGRLDDALASFKAGLDRAPNSSSPALALGQTYLLLRDYQKSHRYLTRAAMISPNGAIAVAFNVLLDLRLGRYDDARDLLAHWEGGPTSATRYAAVELALWTGDLERERRVLEAGTWDAIRVEEAVLPRELLIGQIDDWLGAPDLGARHLKLALQRLDAELRSKPEDNRLYAARGLALAALGRREEAIDAGRHASNLMPVSRDFPDGTSRLRDLASIYAAVGEPVRAFEILRYLLSVPCMFSIEELERSPEWEPLRADPEYALLVRTYAS